MAKKPAAAEEPEEQPAGIQVGERFRFTRSNTVVKVTLVHPDGLVDIEETESQAKDDKKQPIPPRWWGRVEVAKLEPVQ